MHNTQILKIFSCFSLFTHLSLWTERAFAAISIFDYGQIAEVGDAYWSIDSIMVVLCALWLIYVINFNNMKTGK